MFRGGHDEAAAERWREGEREREEREKALGGGGKDARWGEGDKEGR